MTEVKARVNEFKECCREEELNYIIFGERLIIVFHTNAINIRQYALEGSCLSSWINFDSAEIISIDEKQTISK